MKIAVMQPYFFPYMGYFELMKEVDIFVLFSEVQYIRRGWVNRNRIKSRHKEFQFLTVPVEHTNRESPIDSIAIHEGNWHRRHLSTLQSVYPQCKTHPVFQEYSQCPEALLHPMLARTLENVKNYMGIESELADSRTFPKVPRGLPTPADRIIDLCLQLGASEYINLPGGTSLYSPEVFDDFGIKLTFLQPQCTNKLSVLDCLFNAAFSEPSIAEESVSTVQD